MKVYCSNCKNFEWGTGGEMPSPSHCAIEKKEYDNIIGYTRTNYEINYPKEKNKNNDCTDFRPKLFFRLFGGRA